MTNHIETLYQNYLTLSKIKESEMLPIQKSEMRKAFFAGFGSVIKEMKSVATLPSKQSHKIMDEWVEEVNNLFFTESVMFDIKPRKQKSFTVLKKEDIEKGVNTFFDWESVTVLRELKREFSSACNSKAIENGIERFCSTQKPLVKHIRFQRVKS